MKSEQLKEDFVMAKRGGFPGMGMPGNMEIFIIITAILTFDIIIYIPLVAI